MPDPKPELDHSSIVLLGRFNPGIFQPAWFAAHGLIRHEEADNATGLVFAPEVAAFTADWLVIQVTADRFEASTQNTAHSAPLRDLVVSTFRLLEHTPVEKMGINRSVHYRAGSPEQFHRIGHILAPKGHWETLLRMPGMRRLTVWASRPEAPEARIEVTVEPSFKLPNGLFASTNEHYEQPSGLGPQKLMETLALRWDESQAFCLRVADMLLHLG